jgi:hypothetical protein
MFGRAAPLLLESLGDLSGQMGTIFSTTANLIRWRSFSTLTTTVSCLPQPTIFTRTARVVPAIATIGLKIDFT